MRCSETCSCGDNGRCDSITGCVCNNGWTGLDCSQGRALQCSETMCKSAIYLIPPAEINDFSPSFSANTPSRYQITWDLVGGAEILTVAALDDDVGPNSGNVSFSLSSPPYPLPTGVSDGIGIFRIDPESGVITLREDLIAASGSFSEFILTVTASDGGQPPRSTSHMLTVTPVPIPMIRTDTVIMDTIDEELALGTVLSGLQCRETGPSSDSTQIRLSGPGSEFFRIEKLELVVSRRIDYESLPASEREFSITATCSNRYNQRDTIMINATVNNIDDNAFKFERPQYAISLLENVTVGETVATVRAFDRDAPNAAITYIIEPSQGSADFEIIPHTGEIDVMNSLDRELQAEYRLVILASYITSGIVQSASVAVVINVLDLNDEIPVFSESLYRIGNITTRNNIGYLVVVASASDPDAGSNGHVTYTLQQDGSEFTINETTGEVYINASLTQRLHILNITATDGGQNPQSSFALVYIYVQASPNSIQLSLRESPIVVPEDISVGSQIGRVNYVVRDDTGAIINRTTGFDVRFEVVNGSDPTRFLISATTGEIFNLGTLDYDSLAQQYDLLVSATLTSANVLLMSEIAVMIEVQNLNDNPPRFTPRFYATMIEQFTLQGTTILNVSAYDPDALSTIEYSLSGTDSSLFAIDSSTGEISAVVELDIPQDYRFTAVASDGGAEESSAAVFISVTRSVSVAPAFTQSEFVFTLPESAAPGTFVGTVTALTRGNQSSVDFDHLGFRISMPDPINFNATALNISQDLFHIDRETGNISTQALFEFDLESRQDYVFYVEIFNVDNNSLVYDNATVIIRLQDVNDNPPVFQQSLYTRVINASLPLNSIVTVPSASDRDSGNNGRITYSFEGQSVSLGFALNPTSGEITVSNSTLIPGDYYLTIVASDGGDPAMTGSATIFIAVIPVVPTVIEFTQQIYDFQVLENGPPDTLIGTIQAVDVSSSSVPRGIMYSTPNLTDCFSVDMRSGEVRLSCTSLDRESTESYELVILAQVGTTTTRGTMRIQVLDINDNAPVFSLDVFTSIINDRYGMANSILNLTASDSDLGANGTVVYSLVSVTDIFRVDNTSGELFLANETVEIGDYRLVVRATDGGTPFPLSSTALVLICVTRAHPQTLQFASLFFDITENSPPSTEVGTVVLMTNGGNVVNPLEFPNNLQFSIVGGDNIDFFFIDRNTGLLRTSTQLLDREVASSHVIEILANFTQFSNVPVQSITNSFTINVLDVNDNAPVILATYATTIDDSASFDEVIFNVTATDADVGLNATVSFNIDPEPSTLFGVRVAEMSLPFTYGEIFVNDTDNLIPGIYRFMLTATDSGVPSMQSMATVEIIVEHAIPETISFSSPTYTFRILEEGAEGTFAGNVSVLPETPALNDLVFQVTGGSGRDFFNVNPATGEILKSHRSIDRERNTSFFLDIQAFLPGQNPPLIAAGNVTIIIEDINDNFPRFTEGIYPSVGIDTDQLNTATPLTVVSASDMDIGSNAIVEYRIHSIEVNQSEYTDSAPLFVLNNNTGQMFAASLGLPVGDYLVNISASDQGQPVLTSYVSVTIRVQLPAPTSISFTNSSGYTFRLPEQSGISRFARVMLEGIPDYLLQYVTYTSPNPHFDVALHTGDIITRRDFDYEIERMFNFEVTSRFVVTNRIPRIDLSAVVNVTVEIVDINDNTPSFINFPTEITQYEERVRAEVVYTFLANDSDSGSNSELRYSIVSNDVSDLLSIDPASGQLTASAGLDRENSEQGRNHTVSIRVCDQGGVMMRCRTQDTLFRLLDINDNSPRLTSGFTYSVDERLPAQTNVFSFEGTDPDVGANSTIRYFLTSSNVPFTCNEITGQVTLTEELDYEMQTSYDITLMLRDTGDPELDTEYTNIIVNVNNLPDNTPQFNQTLYRNTTGPTVSIGDVLFHMSATDADVGSSNDSLKYAITRVQESGNNRIPNLRIDEDSGEIIAVSNEIFITEANFTISILVYDQSRFNLTNTTTVVLTVIPNPLVFALPEYTATIEEDATVGSAVTTLSIATLSASSNINYRIDVIEPTILPPNTVIFTSSGNGVPAVTISLASEGRGLDRENIPRYVIEVTASRPRNEMATTRLVVEVTDVNDNRPRFLDINGTVVSISEDAVTPTVVTISNATDADIGENARLEYRINTNGDFPFEIDGVHGIIQTRGVLDYEDTSSYNVTVCVSDSGNPRLENCIMYRINIININDEFPRFAAPGYFGEVYAGAVEGDLVLHTELRVFDADDVNNEQPLTFTIAMQNQIQQVEDHRFRVTSRPPYRIIVENLPEEADRESRLLELFVQVADEGGKVARVPLYISIFTSNNLAFFLLQGPVSEDQLLSCEVQASSICAFRVTIAGLIGEGLLNNDRITFYNHSVESQGNEM